MQGKDQEEQRMSKADVQREIANLAMKVEDEKVLIRVWMILEREYAKQ